MEKVTLQNAKWMASLDVTIEVLIRKADLKKTMTITGVKSGAVQETEEIEPHVAGIPAVWDTQQTIGRALMVGVQDRGPSEDLMEMILPSMKDEIPATALEGKKSLKVIGDNLEIWAAMVLEDQSPEEDPLRKYRLGLSQGVMKAIKQKGLAAQQMLRT